MSLLEASPPRGGVHYHTKMHLGHTQSVQQLNRGPQDSCTTLITVGGYEMRGGLGDTNTSNEKLKNGALVGDCRDEVKARNLNVNNYNATVTSPQRLANNSQNRAKNNEPFGLIQNASGTNHNHDMRAKKNNGGKGLLKSASSGTGVGNAAGALPIGEGRRYRVHVTLPDGAVFPVELERPTVGAVRDFISECDDNLFKNIRRRELFQASTGFLHHSNLKQIRIPRQCIRISPLQNRNLDLLEDNCYLDEFGFQVAVCRKPYMFSEGDDMFTLEELDDCRIYLYQCVGEQELNLMEMCPAMKTKTSFLHRLIKARKPTACLALLEETCRFRQLNHSPCMESALMAAAREGFSEVCLAIMARSDFAQINCCEWHHRTNPHHVPRAYVHGLQMTEGSIVPDGGYTALEVALLNKVEPVAIAICMREDFQEMNNVSPGNWTCLMHAINNDLPEACVAILNRPDFQQVNKVNMQKIERNAWQMAKTKAEPPANISGMKDLQTKHRILHRCSLFRAVQLRIQGHAQFRLDDKSAFTVGRH